MDKGRIIQKEFKRKSMSCDEAAKLVENGNWVDFCQVGAFPQGMDEAISKRVGALSDIKLRNAITLKPVSCLENDPDGSTFTYNLCHKLEL